MKILLGTVALLCAAPSFARPHVGKRSHKGSPSFHSQDIAGHGKFHAKKDVTTEIFTDWATVLVPEYVVWVNKNGEPVTTETRFGSIAPATSAPAIFSTPFTAPAEVSTPPQISSSSTTTSNTIPTSSAQPVPTPLSSSSDTSIITTSAASNEDGRVGPTESTSASEPSSTTAPATEAGFVNQHGHASSGGPIYGLAYDILKGNSGQCRTQSEVSSEMAFFKSKAFSHIRIYDVDCNQVNMVTTAAAANDLYVIISLPEVNTLALALPELISQAGANLNRIDTIAIGNEYVNSGGPAQDVLNGLSYARNFLGSAGFEGSIVTIDTWDAILQNPSLCGNSDYVAANCHAFFDSNTVASNAGSYVGDKVGKLQAACGGKRVVITESGWPHQGNSNGVAVPSLANQYAAHNSLVAAFSNGDIVLFQAFDTPYKAPGPFDVEQYFGLQYLASGQAP